MLRFEEALGRGAGTRGCSLLVFLTVPFSVRNLSSCCSTLLAFALLLLLPLKSAIRLNFLRFCLAARFRSRTAIVTGILFATILNHAMAGIFGTFVSQWLTPEVLRWALSIGFILMAGWMLIPDKADDNATECRAKLGAFGTTLLLFFLAEMGDKTQLATVALAAHLSDVLFRCRRNNPRM